MRRGPSAFTAAVVAGAFALVGNLATGVVDVKAAWWPAVVWAATAALLGASIVVEVARRRSETPPPSEIDLNGITDQLAQQTRERWEAEERHRRVTDPAAIPVRWRAAAEDLTDHPANVRKLQIGKTSGPLPLAGDIDCVFDTYQRVPSGRLLILGRAGSGKTVLAARLLLDLVDHREPGGPVPVIVSLGSWNPVSTTLREWLAAQLVRDYPQLAASVDGITNVAEKLLARKEILPILDGFDEINPGLHRRAIEQINATALPFVVTSRVDEFADAIRGTRVVSGAAGIHLDDVTPDDVGHYLPRTAGHSGAHGIRRTLATSQSRLGDDSDGLLPRAIATLARSFPRFSRAVQVDERKQLWDPVLSHLREDPTGVLARALSTPLAVFLARAIYSDTPENDPEELLDKQRFPTSQSIEEHLLAHFIPTVYQQPSPLPHRWSADQAQRWLSYLARHLHAKGTPDLAWWQLRDTVPQGTRSVLFGVMTGLTFGLTFALTYGLDRGLASGPTAGLIHGLTYGLMFGLAFGINATFNGGLKSGIASMLVAGLIGGYIDTLTSKLIEGPYVDFWHPDGPVVGVLVEPILNVLWIGLGNGLLFGLQAALLAGLMFGLTAEEQPTRVRLRFPSLRTLRQRLIVGFTAGLKAALVVALAAVPVEVLVSSWSGLIIFRQDVEHKRNLAFVLMDGFGGGLFYALIFGIAFGLLYGLAAGLVTEFEAPIDMEKVAKGDDSLRADRNNTLRKALIVGLAFGLALGLISWFGDGLVKRIGSTLLLGLFFGILFALRNAWGQWLLFVRLWLPWRGCLPWRVNAFLADAYQRGILRQTGAVYQFRHARLQEHLVNLPTDRPTNGRTADLDSVVTSRPRSPEVH